MRRNCAWNGKAQAMSDAYHVHEHDSEVGRVAGDRGPRDGVGPVVDEAGRVGGCGDRVGQSRGGESEDGGESAHGGGYYKKRRGVEGELLGVVYDDGQG